MDGVGAQDVKAVMAKKLQEHLSNLDQVEQALKVDPNHEELLKLKTDLTELIMLVSKQMLQHKTATTSSSETKEQPPADKMETFPASSDLSDIRGLLSNPNLPSFFHKKWKSKFAEPGSSKPSTSSTTATVASDTEEIPGNKAGDKPKRIRNPRPPGVSRKRAPLTQEQKKYGQKRRKFNYRRNKQIKDFLANSNALELGGLVNINVAAPGAVKNQMNQTTDVLKK